MKIEIYVTTAVTFWPDGTTSAGVFLGLDQFVSNAVRYPVSRGAYPVSYIFHNDGWERVYKFPLSSEGYIVRKYIMWK